MEPASANPHRPRRTLLPALAHRNYRLFFFGQGVSLVGTWMQRMALGVLVFSLTGREFDLGIVGFSSQILTFVIAPFAGVFADRLDRRRVLLAAQTAAMLQAATLAVLTLTGHVQVWHIVVLALLLGFSDGFEIPTRQSFVVQMLESRADLSNAIAMNSFLVHSSRLAGPTLAGFVVAQAGAGVCFLINAVSFLGVIGALLAMRIKPSPPPAGERRMLHNLYDGVKYTFGFAPIRGILILVAGMSLLGVSCMVLLPAYVATVLHEDPSGVGILMGAAGGGALCGAAFLTLRRTVMGLERAMAAGAMLCGFGLVALAFSISLVLSAALMVVVGLGSMIVFASSNTVIQTIVDDDRRGRVMSLYTMCFMGMGPFGSLLAGGVAHGFGSTGAIFMGGCACIAVGAFFACRLRAFSRMIHPVYVRMGLAPEQP